MDVSSEQHNLNVVHNRNNSTPQINAEPESNIGDVLMEGQLQREIISANEIEVCHEVELTASAADCGLLDTNNGCIAIDGQSQGEIVSTNDIGVGIEIELDAARADTKSNHQDDHDFGPACESVEIGRGQMDTNKQDEPIDDQSHNANGIEGDRIATKSSHQDDHNYGLAGTAVAIARGQLDTNEEDVPIDGQSHKEIAHADDTEEGHEEELIVTRTFTTPNQDHHNYESVGEATAVAREQLNTTNGEDEMADFLLAKALQEIYDDDEDIQLYLPPRRKIKKVETFNYAKVTCVICRKNEYVPATDTECHICAKCAK